MTTPPHSAGDAVVASRRVGRELAVYWGVVAVWMTVISLLSTEPFSAQNTNRYIDPVLRFFFPSMRPADFVFAHTVIRKTAHFTEFFILGSSGNASDYPTALNVSQPGTVYLVITNHEATRTD